MTTDIQSILCRGFCDGLVTSNVRGITSVSTPFKIGSGDPLSFYIVPYENGYRIEDDGSLVPLMIAMGINIDDGPRKAEFDKILKASDISYNSETGELYSDVPTLDTLPSAAFRFVNVMLKLDAIKAPMRPEKVASMFKQDVISKMKQTFGAKYSLEFDAAVSEALSNFNPDVILKNGTGKPTAVYLLTSDQRAWEAIALRQTAKYEKHIPCSVVGLSDRAGSKLINKKTVASVGNYLDATPYFYDNQDQAMQRIDDELKVGMTLQ